MATKRILPKNTSAKSSGAKAPSTGVAATRGRGEPQIAKDQSGKKKPAQLGWAGDVLLQGLREEDKEAVLGLVRHTAGTGPRDEADRVVKIEEGKNSLRIQTAQNALAVSIGKRVHRSHKGGELTITWSHDDMPVRVRWTAPKQKNAKK